MAVFPFKQPALSGPAPFRRHEWANALESRKKPHWVAFAGVLCVACAPLIGHSAEDVFSLSLEELINVPVTIASRNEESAPEAPSSVTVFTRSDIRRLGVTTLEELLNFVPGVQTNRTQEEVPSHAPSFRGRRGGHGTRPGILLMVDGRRMNSPVFGGAFHLPLNNLDWIKQVEVIRGPGSAIYGANAFNGVINIITDLTENALTLRTGDLGLIDASVTAARSGEDWQAGIYLHRYEDDGDDYAPFYSFLGTFDPTSDALRRDTAALQFDYKGWLLQGYYSDSERDDFLLGSTMGNDVNAVSFTTESLRAGYEGLSGDEWSANFYFYYISQEDTATLTIQPAELAKDFWWTDGSEVTAIGGNYRRWESQQLSYDVRWQLGSHHLISHGAELREESVSRNPFQGNWDPVLMEESRGSVLIPCDCVSRGFYFGGELADLIPASERRVANVWLQDQWHVRDGVDITLGVRRDDYEDFGGRTSLRASAVIEVNKRNLVKLIYGDAFRAPSLIETRALIASQFVGNPNLDPEVIRTMDLVWQQRWQDISVTTTASQSWLSDDIELVQFDDVFAMGILPFRPENVGSGKLRSIEVEATAALADHWTAKLNASRLISVLGVGQSDVLGSFAVSYDRDRIYGSLGGFYHSSVQSRSAGINGSDRDITLDDYFHINARLGYRVANAWDISLVVNNLLDDQYRSFSSAGGGLENGIPNRGRLAFVELKWSPGN